MPSAKLEVLAVRLDIVNALHLSMATPHQENIAHVARRQTVGESELKTAAVKPIMYT